MCRWIAYFTHVEPRPDLYLSTAVVAHTVAASSWSGEGRRPQFEDYLVKIEEEESLDETAARLILGFGAVKAKAHES